MTYRYKYHNDQQCPTNYNCCYQNCFQHKICLLSSDKVHQQNNNITPVKYSRLGIEKDQYIPPINSNRNKNDDYSSYIRSTTKETEFFDRRIDLQTSTSDTPTGYSPLSVDEVQYIPPRNNRNKNDDYSNYIRSTTTESELFDTSDSETSTTDTSTSTITVNSATDGEFDEYYYHYGDKNSTNYDYEEEDEDE